MITAARLIPPAPFLGFGQLRAGAPDRARAVRIFIPVWFVLARVNVTIGVTSAGDTIHRETPSFASTFGVPAWILSRRLAC
jgi:hypothetical protein